MFIAHRGLYNNNIGENTIRAFDNAFKEGFSGIEFDVRLTKDNIPVIIHDSFISRVSNGVGLVNSFTYKELLKYNFGKKYHDKIPKLTEVIKRYHNKVMIIELKEKINIDKYLDTNNNYYISSFNFEYLKNVKNKRGIINYVLNNNYQNINFIMILYLMINDQIINYYKKNGVEVIAYGVLKNKTKFKYKIKYII